MPHIHYSGEESLQPTVTSDTTLNSERLYIVDPSNSSLNLYLPLASGIAARDIEIFTNYVGSNTVTLLPSGTDTIAGLPSLILPNNTLLRLSSLGSTGKWVVLGSADMSGSSLPNNTYLTTNSGVLHLYADGTSGSDLNSGLTVSSPKKTLESVFELIPDQIQHHSIVHLSGDFDISGKTIILSRQIMRPALSTDVALVIDGGTDVTSIAGPFTSDIQSATTIGVTTMGATTDQYAGYWVDVTSGPASGVRRLIISNTSTTLTVGIQFFSTPTAGSTFSVVRPSTRLRAPSGAATLSFGNVGGGSNFTPRLVVQQLYIDANDISISTGNSPGAITFTHLITDSSQATNTLAFYNSNSCGCAIQRLNLSSITNGALIPSFSFLTSAIGVSQRNSAGRIYINGSTGFTGVFASYARKVVFNDVGMNNVGISFGTRVKGQVIFSSFRTGEQPSITQGASYAAPILIDSSTGVGVTVNSSYVSSTGTVTISGHNSHGIELINSTWKINNPAGSGTTSLLSGGGNGAGGTGFGLYAHLNSAFQIFSGTTPTISGVSGQITTNGTTASGTWAAVDAGTPVVDTNQLTVISE